MKRYYYGHEFIDYIGEMIMYNLEKNVEYMIIAFFGFQALETGVPFLFNFWTGISANMLFIYSGTALCSILMLLVSVFLTKYASIPIYIRVGKLLNKLT